MTLVLGHRVDHYYLEFPHVCPGENCAIANWTLYKATGVHVWKVVPRSQRGKHGSVEAQPDPRTT